MSKTKDGKKIVYYCDCGRVNPFGDEWQNLTPQAKEEIQKQRQDGFIKFVKTICPICQK